MGIGALPLSRSIHMYHYFCHMHSTNSMFFISSTSPLLLGHSQGLSRPRAEHSCASALQQWLAAHADAALLLLLGIRLMTMVYHT
jgi:hypothetical protein